MKTPTILRRRSAALLAAGATAAALLTVGVASATPGTSEAYGAATYKAKAHYSEAYNKKIVLAFYDLAANQHKPREAADRYLGSYYTQHNPQVGDGKEAFVAGFEALGEAAPESKIEFKRVAVDGDLVWVHSHFTFSPTDRGSAVVDIFRVEKGKIVEHWDVIQAVPETAANDNTMF